MFAYCGNNPVMYTDPLGESGVFFAFLAATVVAGVANAASTAINGGTLEDCLVAGAIGAGSAAVGFSIAFILGFSPAGNLAARAASSSLCDLGTTLYQNGKITGQDIASTAIDVTIDVCFSAVTYYYTDPITDFGMQTLLNSGIDGGVDVLEAYVFPAPEKTGAYVFVGNTKQMAGGGSFGTECSLLL